jgi:hypothetical protein
MGLIGGVVAHALGKARWKLVGKSDLRLQTCLEELFGLGDLLKHIKRINMLNFLMQKHKMW